MNFLRYSIILFILINMYCYSFRVVNPDKKMSSFPQDTGTFNVYFFPLTGSALYCPYGLREVQMERNFVSGAFLEFYGIIPFLFSYRSAKADCADSESKVETSSNFNDVVALKNGEILTDVKAAVTIDSVVVTSKDGKVRVFKKKDISAIKKQ